MTPLILGNPVNGGLAVLAAASEGLSCPLTLGWSDRAALEDSVTEILALGASALYVDPEIEGLALASVAHQVQVMGVPQFTAVVVPDESDLTAAMRLARIVLGAIPPAALLVLGPSSVHRAMLRVTSELDLADPIPATLDTIPALAQELVDTARWETV